MSRSHSPQHRDPQQAGDHHRCQVPMMARNDVLMSVHPPCSPSSPLPGHAALSALQPHPLPCIYRSDSKSKLASTDDDPEPCSTKRRNPLKSLKSKCLHVEALAGEPREGRADRNLTCPLPCMSRSTIPAAGSVPSSRRGCPCPCAARQPIGNCKSPLSAGSLLSWLLMRSCLTWERRCLWVQ